MHLIKKSLPALLIFLIASLPIIFQDLSFANIIRQYLFSSLYILTVACCWKYKPIRIISIFMTILWATDLGISIHAKFILNTAFTAEFATTMLATNTSEAIAYLKQYWFINIGFVILIAGYLYIASFLASKISKKALYISVGLFLLCITYKFAESSFKGREKDPSFSMCEKVLPYSSLNNTRAFCRVWKNSEILNQIKNTKVNYQIDTTETGIDTYVVVIGESARRANVGLYDYSRDTTPNLMTQKNNMFIFEHAIAPAPITIMSLTVSLSKRDVYSQDYTELGDNIIHLANSAGFETYWYSMQGMSGHHDSAISILGQFAQHSEWIKTGHDEVLIPKLTSILNQPSSKKRLIFLHTNGSHFDACDRYPEQENYFKGGVSAAVDCYDNSIRYTDKILADIFDTLKDKKAAVLYFSDHGQVLKHKGTSREYFFHDPSHPHLEAMDIPQFIWTSPLVDETQKKIGSLADNYTTSDNYYLIMDWLGIQNKAEENKFSPLQKDYQSRENIEIRDTSGKIWPYRELIHEN